MTSQRENKQTCTSELCFNQGTCLVDRLSPLGFRCACMPYFTGDTCLVRFNPCDLRPCPHDYVCLTNGYTYKCECTNGTACNKTAASASSQQLISDVIIPYLLKTRNKIFRTHGEFMSACSHSPCQNGGLCELVESKAFCKCPVGFEGRFCETSESYGLDYCI